MSDYHTNERSQVRLLALVVNSVKKSGRLMSSFSAFSSSSKHSPFPLLSRGAVQPTSLMGINPLKRGPYRGEGRTLVNVVSRFNLAIRFVLPYLVYNL
jgi:hypothetical protein